MGKTIHPVAARHFSPSLFCCAEVWFWTTCHLTLLLVVHPAKPRSAAPDENRRHLTGAASASLSPPSPSAASSPGEESAPSPSSARLFAPASLSPIAARNLRDSSADARFKTAVSGDETLTSLSPPTQGLRASHRSSCRRNERESKSASVFGEGCFAACCVRRFTKSQPNSRGLGGISAANSSHASTYCKYLRPREVHQKRSQPIHIGSSG